MFRYKIFDEILAENKKDDVLERIRTYMAVCRLLLSIQFIKQVTRRKIPQKRCFRILAVFWKVVYVPRMAPIWLKI